MNKDALNAIRIAVKNDHSVSNLEQVGVSQRLINLLQKNKINNIGDLMYRKKEELLKINNFGPKQLSIVLEALSNYHHVVN